MKRLKLFGYLLGCRESLATEKFNSLIYTHIKDITNAFTLIFYLQDVGDKQWDYGIAAGLGLGVIVKRFEFHIEGGFNYSLSMLYHPEKMSSSWWIYSYPWRATINFGIHYKIK